MVAEEKKWEWEISNQSSYWGTHFTEIWAYRHLLSSLVRRDFLVNYQQTILGPAWMLLQPVLTLVTYALIFGRLVGLSTGSLPPLLFYFSGIILWNFFNDSFGGTNNIFRDNAQVFSKVYFPRLVVPIAIMCTRFIRFGISLFLLLLMIGYYMAFKDFSPNFSSWLLALPVVVLAVGAMSLGLGLAFSVITAKYRDISGFVSLGTRLLMFATPVIYPVLSLPEDVRWIVHLNPLTPLFELFRLSLLGEGVVSYDMLFYSLAFSFLVLVVSLLLFNKKGDSLIDIV